ncbi:MAG: hypothetical protein H0X51_00655 [Parachlamydiaceae bacterium]|nr:hypothetical protein [Parachlamydiaceae bacterium]
MSTSAAHRVSDPEQPGMYVVMPSAPPAAGDSKGLGPQPVYVPPAAASAPIIPARVEHVQIDVNELNDMIEGALQDLEKITWPAEDKRWTQLRRDWCKQLGIRIAILACGMFLGIGLSQADDGATRYAGLALACFCGGSLLPYLMYKLIDSDGGRAQQDSISMRPGIKDSGKNLEYIAFLNRKLQQLYGPVTQLPDESDELFNHRKTQLESATDLPPQAKQEAFRRFFNNPKIYRIWKDFIRPVNAKDQGSLESEIETEMQKVGFYLRKEVRQQRLAQAMALPD